MKRPSPRYKKPIKVYKDYLREYNQKEAKKLTQKLCQST